jgi:hypothetical protein
MSKKNEKNNIIFNEEELNEQAEKYSIYDLKLFCKMIEMKGVDIFDSYVEYMNTAAILNFAFGFGALPYFKQLSSLRKDYDEAICEKKYKEAEKVDIKGKDLSYVYMLAKNKIQPIKIDKNEFNIATGRVVKKHSIVIMREYLSQLYVFRYNKVLCDAEFRRIKEKEWYKLEETNINSILIDMKENHYEANSMNLHTLLNSDCTERHDPFKNYLDNLPQWDGTD